MVLRILRRSLRRSSPFSELDETVLTQGPLGALPHRLLRCRSRLESGLPHLAFADASLILDLVRSDETAFEYGAVAIRVMAEAALQMRCTTMLSGNLEAWRQTHAVCMQSVSLPQIGVPPISVDLNTYPKEDVFDKVTAALSDRSFAAYGPGGAYPVGADEPLSAEQSAERNAFVDAFDYPHIKAEYIDGKGIGVVAKRDIGEGTPILITGVPFATTALKGFCECCQRRVGDGAPSGTACAKCGTSFCSDACAAFSQTGSRLHLGQCVSGPIWGGLQINGAVNSGVGGSDVYQSAIRNAMTLGLPARLLVAALAEGIHPLRQQAIHTLLSLSAIPHLAKSRNPKVKTSTSNMIGPFDVSFGWYREVLSRALGSEVPNRLAIPEGEERTAQQMFDRKQEDVWANTSSVPSIARHLDRYSFATWLELVGRVTLNSGRTNIDSSEGKYSVSVLSPHFALFNHSCFPNATWAMTVSPTIVTVKALRDIAEGEEMTISYVDSSDKGHANTLANRYRVPCDCYE